jgi:hypothetical protein
MAAVMGFDSFAPVWSLRPSRFQQSQEQAPVRQHHSHKAEALLDKRTLPSTSNSTMITSASATVLPRPVQSAVITILPTPSLMEPPGKVEEILSNVKSLADLSREMLCRLAETQRGNLTLISA